VRSALQASPRRADWWTGPGAGGLPAELVALVPAVFAGA
jgi:hypothetical protein